MALIRWNPFKGLVNVPQDADRLFEEFLGRFPVELDGGSGTWSPAVDVSEDKDNIYFTVEIPGMSKEDVKVTMLDNILTIQGEKKLETEKMVNNSQKYYSCRPFLTKDANFHRVERSYSQQQSKIILLLTIFDYGSFVRSFSLPAGILADKIKAQYQDGLLKITLPKTEQVKPKEITIAMEGK